MSLAYCNEKLVALRSEELEREARLEGLRAEARRAARQAAADRPPMRARVLSALHLLPTRTPSWAR